MIYVVKEGDTLSGIAQRLNGDSSLWRELKLVNRARPKGPPFSDRIYPGDLLKVPMDWRVPFMLSPAYQALMEQGRHGYGMYRESII